VQTINRIVDVFPMGQQQQIRTQLSFVLNAVFCQQLIPKSNGKGRVLASEIMLANPAVRALIRENKAHQVYSIIQVSGKIGMKTMNQSLYEIHKAGHVTFEDAAQYSGDLEDLKKTFMRGEGFGRNRARWSRSPS